MKGEGEEEHPDRREGDEVDYEEERKQGGSVRGEEEGRNK